MRVEQFSDGVHVFGTELREVIEKLFVYQFKSLTVTFVFRFFVRSQGLLESIEHRNQLFDDASSRAFLIFGAFLFRCACGNFRNRPDGGGAFDEVLPDPWRVYSLLASRGRYHPQRL